MEKTALGQKIREVRVSKGYTQQSLAHRAQIGVMYLGEIERGLKMPSMNIFVKLVEALEVSADYVLRDEVSSGCGFVCDDIAWKLRDLTPVQRKTAAEILEAYLRSLR